MTPEQSKALLASVTQLESGLKDLVGLLRTNVEQLDRASQVAGNLKADFAAAQLPSSRFQCPVCNQPLSTESTDGLNDIFCTSSRCASTLAHAGCQGTEPFVFLYDRLCNRIKGGKP